MITQRDIEAEDSRQKRRHSLEKALEFELERSILLAGAVLTGFSIKITQGYTLMTLRAIVNDRPSVAFIGAESIVDCILKASTKAKSGKLNWQADRYATDEV